MSSLSVPSLDGPAAQRAVLGPRAVVVPDVRLAQQLVQHEPGVRGALADPAVGNRVLAEVQARLVAVERAQRVVRAAWRSRPGRRSPCGPGPAGPASSRSSPHL